ncbi:MAG: RHS repeat-associated core domain-containing protein, partial [Chitinophagales bacterium]
MVIPGRNFSSEKYRFSFNGQLKDDELKGAGNSYDFGSRIYDPRLGKWFSIDPVAREYAYLSPYTYCNNSPIVYI